MEGAQAVDNRICAPYVPYQRSLWMITSAWPRGCVCGRRQPARQRRQTFAPLFVPPHAESSLRIQRTLLFSYVARLGESTEGFRYRSSPSLSNSSISWPRRGSAGLLQGKTLVQEAFFALRPRHMTATADE